MKKAFDQLHKRMQKHLNQTEALHSNVWSALQAYMQRLMTHVYEVGGRCYQLDSGQMEGLPTPRDTLALMAAIRPLS